MGRRTGRRIFSAHLVQTDPMVFPALITAVILLGAPGAIVALRHSAATSVQEAEPQVGEGAQHDNRASAVLDHAKAAPTGGRPRRPGSVFTSGVFRFCLTPAINRR